MRGVWAMRGGGGCAGAVAVAAALAGAVGPPAARTTPLSGSETTVGEAAEAMLLSPGVVGVAAATTGAAARASSSLTQRIATSFVKGSSETHGAPPTQEEGEEKRVPTAYTQMNFNLMQDDLRFAGLFLGYPHALSAATAEN